MCDVRDGIHSMPADRGVPRALARTRVLHALTVALLVVGGMIAVVLFAGAFIDRTLA